MILSDGTQIGRSPGGTQSDGSHSGLQSIDDEACEWVERFAQRRGSRADVAALKRWMARSPAHAEAFDRMSRVWTSLEPVGQAFVTRGLVSRRPRQAETAVLDPSRIGRRAFIGGALAASAAGVAVLATRPPLDLWPSWSELAADFRTIPGEQRQIMLAEQVAIDLNTRSSLAVLSAGTQAQLIAGEAMISSPSQLATPFTLLAGDGRVIAADSATANDTTAKTSARFNVRIDGEAVCVTCVAGGVQVEQRASSVTLSAGRQVNYSAGRGMGQPVSVDPAVVTAWQDGIVIFEATPVANVIDEINRYRPGKIILTNSALGRRLFDARLRIENIGNVVRQIELAFGARARELPGGIVLLG